MLSELTNILDEPVNLQRRTCVMLQNKHIDVEVHVRMVQKTREELHAQFRDAGADHPEVAEIVQVFEVRSSTLIRGLACWSWLGFRCVFSVWNCSWVRALSL